MNKNQSPGVYILIAIVMALIILAVLAGPTTTTPEISYTQFIKKVENKEIKSVDMSKGVLIAIPVEGAAVEAPATNILGLSEGVQKPKLQYKVQIPDNDQSLYKILENNNVEIKVKRAQEGGVGGMLLSIIGPVILIIIMIVIIRAMQQGGSQAMSFGKSKAKLMLDSKVKITFKDVAGIDEEKQELEEIVDFLKNGDKYTKLGAKIPKGVLLVGPPGTGKTLMAKAVAGEAGVPFFSISGSDFVEMFVGVGASRVRDLFEQAKKHQPCIIFIDEIDAVGRQRGAGMGGGHDEREQTLNQLLVEMDGFDENVNIIIIAATNRPDILDNALLRPGRFDRQIYINIPDVKGREQILNVHAKEKPLAKDVDLKVLAKRTPGFTGADLQSVLNEAALLTARRGKAEITMLEIDDSIDRVIAGIEKKSKVMTDKDKEITAYHEVGHALILKLTDEGEVLHKVSIIPRGMALGITWHKPKDESVHMTKAKLLNKILVSLGGRAAEEIIYGKDFISTGASSDLQSVTYFAKKMVMAWGMTEKLGNVVYGTSNENVFLGRDFGHQRDFSDEIAKEIDGEIKKISDKQYEEAKRLLSENRDMLEGISRELLERETLEENEFEEIMQKIRDGRGS